MRAAALCLGLLACGSGPSPGDPLPRQGDEISVCGELFHTGTRVVLWNDPKGYDAYRPWNRFTPPRSPAKGPTQEAEAEPVAAPRYGKMRGKLTADLAARVEKDGWRLEDLRKVVHLFVIHYDAAGTSRQCFKILQDLRGLSVHFMLDQDGTIYQTLDLKERAWHATIANDASVGIEIAHPGSAPRPDDPSLLQWYHRDAKGLRVVLPSWLGASGFRDADFVPRPARPAMFRGSINGHERYQYDFTDAQYRALALLTATLHRVLPRIELRVPRAADGSVRTEALSPEELASFDGLVGHWHVTTRKQDPGPAFDWARLLREAAGD